MIVEGDGSQLPFYQCRKRIGCAGTQYCGAENTTGIPPIKSFGALRPAKRKRWLKQGTFCGRDEFWEPK
jgi:hypothetical protein